MPGHTPGTLSFLFGFKDAGKVGLWTKADSVIQFDDLTVTAK